ncbi:MAG: DUF2933 domain-containing protein [Burkholderiales bacterium]
MNTNRPSESGSFWRSRSGIASCAFLAIAAAFLFLEHRAHIWPWLPYLLLLACPLLHVFMHGGHSGHSHGAGQAAPRDPGQRDVKDGG